MDADVLRWILDFLVRSSIPNELLKKIIAVIPFPSVDSLLLKAFLLRVVQADVSKASVSETLLEVLEVVEELDWSNGIPIMDSMRAAYCAVAVECTVKYITVCPNYNEEYFSAVKRIWRRRISYLGELERRSELIGDDLKQWRDGIEAAVWDLEASERLGNLNTRKDALDKLKAYLEEAWVTMGPTFLASIVRMMKEKNLSCLGGSTVFRVEECGVGRCDVMDGEANLDEEARGNVEERKRSTSELETDNVGGDGAEADDGARVRVDQGCNAEIGMGLGSGAVNVIKAQGTGDNRTGRQVEERDIDETQGLIMGDFPANAVTEVRKGNLLHKQEHAAYRKRCKGVKIRTPEEEETNEDGDSSCSNHDPLPNSEVKKVREALISSSLELQALVKDPLPDALRMSEFARSELEKRNMNEKPPIDIQRNDARTSLMERNNTAHTYEWEDSIDESPKGSSNCSRRFHVPSPSKNKISPLKKYTFEKITKRRKVRKWTLEEEDTLRMGVQKFGAGNWKLILNSYRDIFEERTEVDLKDKWRNMTRY